jgi:hypothetical protein
MGSFGQTNPSTVGFWLIPKLIWTLVPNLQLLSNLIQSFIHSYVLHNQWMYIVSFCVIHKYAQLHTEYFMNMQSVNLFGVLHYSTDSEKAQSFICDLFPVLGKAHSFIPLIWRRRQIILRQFYFSTACFSIHLFIKHYQFV